MLLWISFSSTPNAFGNELNLGMAAARGGEAYLKEATALGLTGHAVFYHRVGKGQKLDYINVPTDIPITLAVKFPGSTGAFESILSGNFDNDLGKLTQWINKSKRPITVRLMPEFNGDWNPDGAYKKGNDPAQFVSAYRYVAKLLKGKLGKNLIGFDLNYNRKSAKGHGVSDFEKLYPGDEYVDIVTVSTYNRCGAGPYHKKQQSFKEGFKEAYQALSFVKKPLGIAEVSTTSMCNKNKIRWFENMFDDLEEQFTRVTQVTFFLETVGLGEASNDVVIEWGIADQDVGKFRAMAYEISGKKGASLPMVDRNVDNSEVPATLVALLNARSEKTKQKLGPPVERIRYPWVVVSQYTHTLDEVGNPAISPATQQPFGDLGGVYRLLALQAVEFEFAEKITVGIRGGVSLVESTNNIQWWNNATTFVLEPQVCHRGRINFADWNLLCVYGGVHQIEYHVETPNRYDRSLFSEFGDFRPVVGARFLMGGDWGKHSF